MRNAMLPFGLDPFTYTRHVIALGQTGSGKTGAAIAIVEAIAATGRPVIILCPKGDLSNLHFVFEDFAPHRFRPWLEVGQAQRAGTTVDALAEEVARAWQEGLAAEGRLDLAAWRSKVEVRVLTPGDALAPVNLLSALSNPPRGLSEAALADAVTGIVGPLLHLLGLPSNPMRDPEAVLVAEVLLHTFRQGRAVSVTELVEQVLDPPFSTVGAMELEAYLSSRERQALARRLNHLVAAPGFSVWCQGEPLDPAAWVQPRNGRTPITILSLNHLNDAERQVFVARFLHEVVAWTRTLPGSGDLTALVMIDEVFGFLPPHPANPPSKTPLLTLLKQARSVGVGVLLCTQNPVDLDYKALGNAGTWLIGRLSTANDRQRVIEGLGVDPGDLPRRLAGLSPRTFVVRHLDGSWSQHKAPHTRAWLRGPLTLRELARLMPEADPPAAMPVRWRKVAAARWRPAVYARATVTWAGLGIVRTVHRLWSPADRIAAPQPVEVADAEVTDVPQPGVCAALPAWIDAPDEIEALRSALAHHLAEIPLRRWRSEVAWGAFGEDRDATAARLGERPDRLVEERFTPSGVDVHTVWLLWEPDLSAGNARIEVKDGDRR